MGNVITFENGKRKKKTFNPNKEESKMVAEKTTSEGSSTDVDYAKLEPEQQIEYWKNLEKEEEERFKEKYKNVLAAVPGSAGEKCSILLLLCSNCFLIHSMEAGMQDLIHGWISASSTLLVLILLTVTISMQIRDWRDHINTNPEQWQQKNWRRSWWIA